ncbi:MAG: D-alanyl-D-alanine carboxypeptidase family protein [Candidatus Zambryskibacteria bacterium]|nr:D-alanyl-D-alanine carboxypeptidase family protein [Candidatus Zambryskibacteria bacterium]
MNGQITKGIPVEEIKKIIIKETNEFLVEILETDKLSLLKEHKYLDARLRESAQKLLYVAASYLPNGYKLFVVTAYRPIWMQKELYRRREKQLAIKHPLLMIFQHSKWRKLVNRYTSPPGGSSHQYGGAVDIMVIDSKGNRLDMGTTLTDFGMKVHTENNLITEKQRKNRKTLYDAMTKAGFVNYPLEWWHYSYGDRMWAAYTNRKECFYGPMNMDADSEINDFVVV